MKHVHASGKSSHPSATSNQLARALTTYFLDYRADVITLTEMSRMDLALRNWAVQYGCKVYHPTGWGKSECAILSRAPLKSQHTSRLSSLTLRTARVAPLYAVAAQLQDGPWFSVTHLPAHTGGLDPREWSTRVYISALSGWHTARLQMRGGGVVMAADWNLALELAKNRKLLARPYPGMSWGWHPQQESTQGGRVIDGVLTNRPIKSPSRTLPVQPGFDHRAVLTVLG